MTAPRMLPVPAARTATGADEGADPRVAAVLQVMGGAAVADVARQCSVEPALVHRWVRIFTEAGTARLTNRPEPTQARERDRFLAAFAHELRTPLAIAQGWATVLADGELPDEMVAATATKLSTALASVADRTREVEYLAAAALGRLRVTPRPVAARSLAPPSLDDPVLGDAGVVAMTDPDLAGRVVRDLWKAAAMQPTPGRRHVEVREHGPWAEVRVVRHGDPIDTRVLQALYEPFDRNDDDTGVTVGLYLARALSVALGGTTGVDQDAAHTVFWLRLPLAPTPRPLES